MRLAGLAVAQTAGVIRRRVVVSGRVQGVWYRESCRRQAEALGVAGWVRNNPDGTVEAAVEGATQAVDQLVRWMELGPRQAQVVKVEVADEPVTGDVSFVVR